MAGEGRCKVAAREKLLAKNRGVPGMVSACPAGAAAFLGGKVHPLESSPDCSLTSSDRKRMLFVQLKNYRRHSNLAATANG